ncbi:hypothetical protein F4821DRAFT_261983 [Hypoxylon rubiginosum]|uniref:Uncharacterized protein n=1 Tax=Hypoxylon rubiginosum TaxID=110542 RepID=A0ACC0CVW6_9PEZI|nr:hypothetical protein F4821DRAFT_261983 [Hypoxylon rubiginosum]
MFEIRSSPENGKGLFATQAITLGDRLIQEKPIISLNYEEDDGEEWMYRLYKEFTNLSREDQVKYRNLPHKLEHSLDKIRSYLHRRYGLKGEVLEIVAKSWNKLASIWSTNNVGLVTGRIGLLDGQEHTGVFLTHPRINHSCVPNTTWSVDDVRKTIKVTAIRDIAVGEEITISYINTERPSHIRKADLERYSLECLCKACSGLGKDISDQNRQRLWELKAMFWIYEEGSEDLQEDLPADLPADRRINDNEEALKLASEFVDLLKAEGLLGVEAIHGYNRLKDYIPPADDYEGYKKANRQFMEYRRMFLDVPSGN